MNRDHFVRPPGQCIISLYVTFNVFFLLKFDLAITPQITRGLSITLNHICCYSALVASFTFSVFLYMYKTLDKGSCITLSENSITIIFRDYEIRSRHVSHCCD